MLKWRLRQWRRESRRQSGRLRRRSRGCRVGDIRAGKEGGRGDSEGGRGACSGGAVGRARGVGDVEVEKEEENEEEKEPWEE